MNDLRTTEQREADEALSAAVERVARAYGSIQPNTVVTSWAVVGTALGADDQGDLFPDFILLPHNGQGSSYLPLIGMLRAAQLRVEASYMERL